jgi:MarR family transcriptional regulator, organic hydroperoxide resistance regulator
MARTKTQRRMLHPTPQAIGLGRGATRGKDRFPPLSTTLDVFLRDGSDGEFRRLIYELTSIFNLMVRTRRNFAAYMGVTEPQALMMFIIAETQAATVGQIAQRIDVSSQFVTIEIGNLVKKGIVEKRPNEDDGRSMFLSLTSKGQSLLRELAPLRCKANDTTFRSLTMDRIRTLHDILNNLISDGRIALHEFESPDMLGRRAPSA